ncbi:MAG: hypothetical protein MUQ12_02810, partial [Loktanella sp.]|nr:hypothetical protein [Loktanella sp.]
MQSDLFETMLEVIAVEYEAESDPQGPHTAQTLMVTPSPVALDSLPPCAFDADIRALLATSNHPVARAVLAAQTRLPWGANP